MADGKVAVARDKTMAKNVTHVTEEESKELEQLLRWLILYALTLFKRLSRFCGNEDVVVKGVLSINWPFSH